MSVIFERNLAKLAEVAGLSVGEVRVAIPLFPSQDQLMLADMDLTPHDLAAFAAGFEQAMRQVLPVRPGPTLGSRSN